jgi:capsule polysaccharide export protein KpsC/LpsZ
MVGNPLLDKFATKKVNIDVKNPFALICTQPYDKLVDMGILKSHQALEMIVMLTQIVIQNPDVYFYIKVHPSEDIKKYEGLFLGVDTGNFQIRNDITVQEALKLVDVQISMASYTSFEAVVAGVPIIIIHPEFINFFDQFDYNISFAAKSMFEFNKYLQYSLEPQYRQAFAMDRNNYLNKKLSYFGHSAEITANTIKKVIEWQRPGYK